MLAQRLVADAIRRGSIRAARAAWRRGRRSAHFPCQAELSQDIFGYATHPSAIGRDDEIGDLLVERRSVLEELRKLGGGVDVAQQRPIAPLLHPINLLRH